MIVYKHAIYVDRDGCIIARPKGKVRVMRADAIKKFVNNHDGTYRTEITKVFQISTEDGKQSSLF